MAQVPIKTDGSDTNEIKDYRDSLRVQDIVRQMYNETKKELKIESIQHSLPLCEIMLRRICYRNYE